MQPGALPSLNDLVTQNLITDRLPAQLKHEWFHYKCKILRQEGAVPFDKLATWIEEQAAIARCETAHAPALMAATVLPASTSVASALNTPSVAQPTYLPPSRRTDLQSQVPCRVCHRTGTGHDIAGCPTFQRMSPTEQRSLGVCFKCLNPACNEFGSKCKGNGKLKEHCTCRGRQSDGRRAAHNEAMKCTAE